ncbi:hypothetical protein HK101_005316, partial [Irineochytrium annulatum]
MNIQPLVSHHFPNHSLHVTLHAGHAHTLSRDAICHPTEPCVTVVAIGGDGTIGQVVAGYVEARGAERCARVGIIPAGTGGDFVRTFGGSFWKDPFKDFMGLIAGEERVIDAGRAWITPIEGDGKDDMKGHEGDYNKEGGGHGGDQGEGESSKRRDDDEKISSRKGMVERTFVNVASFGISGTVVQMVDKATYTKMAGSWSYWIQTVLANLSFSQKRVRVRIEQDGATQSAGWIESTLYLFAIGNGRYFGGNMCVVPDAEPGDGK